MTRLRADKRTISRLIERVLRYAKMLDLEEVEVWNRPQISEDIVAKSGGKDIERLEEHLPSMRLYFSPSSSSLSSSSSVEWMWNERYVWC